MQEGLRIGLIFIRQLGASELNTPITLMRRHCLVRVVVLCRRRFFQVATASLA
jgi:hypothetical protein